MSDTGSSENFAADSSVKGVESARHEIKESICRILEGILGLRPDGMQDSMSLDDLDADSLDMIEILMAIEEEFGFEFEDDKFDSVSTVGDLIALTQQTLSAKRSA